MIKNQLLSKIHNHTAIVAVIGLGYVGLPLAVAFAEKGFPVVGIDVDNRKVDALKRGELYVQDIPSARLSPLTQNLQLQETISAGTVFATTDFGILAQCDAAIICVPTPLNKTRDPDVRYHDPYVAQFAHNGHGLRSEPDMVQALANADCVVVATDHSVYDWQQLAQMPVAIVDTRHVVS